MELVCKSMDVSKDVVDILQMVDLNVNTEYKEYIPIDATLKEIKKILENKKKVERSFAGYAQLILNGISNSKNQQLALYNLNFLLNVDNRELTASEISEILAITEATNNGSKSVSEYYSKRYGYVGDKLTEEMYNHIQAGRKADEIIRMKLTEMQKAID